MAISEIFEIFSKDGFGLGYWILWVIVIAMVALVVFLLAAIIRSIVTRDVNLFVSKVERLTVWTGNCGALLIPLLTGTMFYEVISRYVFDAPTFWAYELSYMLMGANLIFSIGYCTMNKGHVRVDFIYANMPIKLKNLSDLVGFSILLLPVSIVITFHLFFYFFDSLLIDERSSQSAWGPIVWPFKFVLFYGMLVFSLQVVAEAIRCAQSIVGRDPNTSGSQLHVDPQ